MVKNKLKEILDEKGIKYIFVAEKSGVNKATLSNVISDRHSPSIEVALRIAKALDLKVEDIWILED